MVDLIISSDSVIRHDTVLGLDLLTGGDAKIDCSAETLSCFGKVLPLHRLDTETTVYGFDQALSPSNNPELRAY